MHMQRTKLDSNQEGPLLSKIAHELRSEGFTVESGFEADGSNHLLVTVQGNLYRRIVLGIDPRHPTPETAPVFIYTFEKEGNVPTTLKQWTYAEASWLVKCFVAMRTDRLNDNNHAMAGFWTEYDAAHSRS